MSNKADEGKLVESWSSVSLTKHPPIHVTGVPNWEWKVSRWLKNPVRFRTYGLNQGVQGGAGFAAWLMNSICLSNGVILTRMKLIKLFDAANHLHCCVACGEMFQYVLYKSNVSTNLPNSDGRKYVCNVQTQKCDFNNSLYILGQFGTKFLITNTRNQQVWLLVYPVKYHL